MDKEKIAKELVTLAKTLTAGNPADIERYESHLDDMIHELEQFKEFKKATRLLRKGQEELHEAIQKEFPELDIWLNE